MSDNVKRFANLFRGSNLAHGVWRKENGHMSTEASSATEEDFRKHLDGELGLGIIPVTPEGTCYFGAIDIDVVTINHKDLYANIHSRNLPLSVCRSKSGGAHLYVFFRDPYPSTSVKAILKKWAGLLGFPNSTEIFPKQTKSTKDAVGNWINLPYFDANNTVRYSITESGSIEIDQFLDLVQFYTGKEEVNEKISSDLIQIDLMPPCLKAITEEGLTEGSRNDGLFNYGVFYRKSSPNGWQDKLHYHNQNFVKPPLPYREVEELIKSLSNREYQYKCNQQPICSHCDRETCLTLAYGVSNKPWQNGENYDEVSFCNLRKIETDPPTYKLEVNGRDLDLTSNEIFSFTKLRKRLFEIHDIVIKPMKQDQWETKTRELLNSLVKIPAPFDASTRGSVVSLISEFISASDNFSDRESLLRGNPIQENGSILFQVNSLQRFVQARKVKVENNELFAILNNMGGDFLVTTILGKTLPIWRISTTKVSRQTENFTSANFPKKGSDFE